ncbi:hypothetical protein [Streptomyces poriferorum]|uniref:Uncharacterized protein n=1 Tax=Streptomyces poriferorum TaxID=2798799 RepID=A0ABY9IJ39_9ACTN|nr:MULTISPECIES: hypothetical protein [unclassified Streptomyces]MDP5316833.1 hypothetical protein [Streptomyces sp. Alt4]WLQ55120.1 hypothetical protein P8A19_06565 [Streptomyces sp. Alt2]
MIRNGIIVTAVLCASLAAAPLSAAAASDGWQRVGSGLQGGVSGIALVEGAPTGPGLADAVVVRDNKGDRESRLATVRLRPGDAPVVTELPWLGVLPADLEALDAVPGRPGHYVALAGRGEAYHVVVADGRATAEDSPVALPGRQDGDNYESFALHRDRSGRTFAVWATRGSGAQQAVVHAASVRVGPNGLSFGTVSARQEFAVPFPDQDEVRHISDLKVLDDGTVLVSSASDPNVNDGPFASAVYDAGRLTVNRANDAVLRMKPRHALTPLSLFTRQDNRKIEAIAFLPGRLGLWGTDDENFGGSVTFERVG